MPRLSRTEVARLSLDERKKLDEAKQPSRRGLPFCPAQVRKGERAGEPCSRNAGQGTEHPGFGYCSKHGGNTLSGRKAAAREYGRQMILDQKERFGGDRTSPYISNIMAETALLEEVRRSVAMVRWLEERIGKWELDAQAGILATNETGLPALVEETSKGAPGMTDVQAWLILYREERKHAATVAKMCIDANISRRMVDIAESQGNALMRVVQAVLKALDLTDVQIQKVPMVVPQVIREATWQLEKTASQRVTKDKDEPVHVITTAPGPTPYKG